MLEALQARLDTMTESELALFKMHTMQEFLASGELPRLDPDQDPCAIDRYPDDEDPSVDEMVQLRILDMIERQMEHLETLKKWMMTW
jgi:hypothetical protein